MELQSLDVLGDLGDCGSLTVDQVPVAEDGLVDQILGGSVDSGSLSEKLDSSLLDHRL